MFYAFWVDVWRFFHLLKIQILSIIQDYYLTALSMNIFEHHNATLLHIGTLKKRNTYAFISIEFLYSLYQLTQSIDYRTFYQIHIAVSWLLKINLTVISYKYILFWDWGNNYMTNLTFSFDMLTWCAKYFLFLCMYLLILWYNKHTPLTPPKISKFRKKMVTMLLILKNIILKSDIF